MFNEKLQRVHRVISYGYFAFIAIAFLASVLALVRGGEGNEDGLGLGIGSLIVVGPFGLLHWYAAKGTRLGTKWGRRMSKGLGILLLFGFPIGTILGVYILAQTGAKWQSSPPESGA